MLINIRRVYWESVNVAGICWSTLLGSVGNKNHTSEVCWSIYLEYVSHKLMELRSVGNSTYIRNVDQHCSNNSVFVQPEQPGNSIKNRQGNSFTALENIRAPNQKFRAKRKSSIGRRFQIFFFRVRVEKLLTKHFVTPWESTAVKFKARTASGRSLPSPTSGPLPSPPLSSPRAVRPMLLH